jgi:antitoxin component YwqK of YwqJK toxin-antitoxin module
MLKRPFCIAIVLLSFACSCAAGERVFSLKDVTFNNSIAYDKQQNLPITGVVTEHSDSGVLLSEISYSEGIKNGVAKAYFDSGALLMERHFEHGAIVGVVKVYYESGGLLKEQSFQNGKMNGLQITYDKSGKIRNKTVYKEGKPVSSE